MNPDTAPAPTVRLAVVGTAGSQIDIAMAINTAAPRPIDRARLLTAAATKAPATTPGTRPARASAALRRSTSA